MAKTKHTHKGNCQACGSLQAVDPSTGHMAKHGYTVDNGYFNGTCTGSDREPIQARDTHLVQVVAGCLNDAFTCDEFIKQLDKGEIHPDTVKSRSKFNLTTRKMDPVYVHWNDATELQRSEEVARTRRKYINRAVWMRDHVKFLTDLKERLLGTELIPANNRPAPLTVGDKIKYHTYTVTITEIKDAICRGVGPHLNGRTMPHAYFQIGSKEYSIPIRLARRCKAVK